ncbi:MAG: hypothetical protein ACRDO4_04885 [Nocardioides sp.]
MKRSVKVTIATIATALVATMGVAGVASTTEAGKQATKDHSWCC